MHHITVDGLPNHVAHSFLPAARYAGAVDADFSEGSLYDFLRREYQADLARERNEARSAAVRAALDRLAEIQAERHDHVEDRAVEHMRKQLEIRLERYRKRLDLLENADSDELPTSPQYEAALTVRRAVIGAQREELLRWRDSGNLNDEGLRILERELDHEERLLPDRSS